MLKKLLLLSFALIFIASFVNAGPRLTKAQRDVSYGAAAKMKLVGDNYCTVHDKISSFFTNSYPIVSNPKTDFMPWDTISILRNTLVTDNSYDMQSNGTCYEIIQDPNNPNKIHVIVMYAPMGDGTSSPNRRTKYYYSTDRGNTFTYVGNVSEDRTGYSSICLNLAGVETISSHVSSAPCFYLDAAAGLGSWTKLIPEQRPYVWGRTAYTNSTVNPNKFVTMYAPNRTSDDSAFWYTCTSINPAPGTFGPYNLHYGCDGERYGIAKGEDGRIGIIYAANIDLVPGDVGDMYFMESTDNGTTFGTPLKFYDADVSPSGDSLGGLDGMGIVYQGNNPCVVFETGRMTTEGTYYPEMNQNIRFWSKTLPGSDPNRSIVIVDSNNTPLVRFIYSISNAKHDAFVSYCRPSIGRSITGNGLFVAFMRPAGWNSYDGAIWSSPDTVAYESTFITFSEDGGANWVTPKRITPIDTTTVGGQYTKMRDFTFPCVSPFNDADAQNWYMNMVVIEDSVPGTFVNHEANGESKSKQLFMRVKIQKITIGINNISNITPEKYSLNQNYPNPFNPVTSIRFSIPKVSVVTLKVYDITGKLVSTLVNNETVSIGEKEVRFDASNLSSGVYFYSINAGDFSDTRKMVVVK
jgi:hypothetical protein